MFAQARLIFEKYTPKVNFFSRPSCRLLLPLLVIATFVCAGCQFLGVNQKGRASKAPDAKNPCVVLALPASGPYAPTAQKIKKGASLAQQELMAAGINLRLENINTEQADWLNKLQQLPQMCQVVGGPLKESSYMAARKSGVLQKRIFFAFTPDLQPGDEGVTAWRFFPSQQDQIDALVHFAMDGMNVHSFGAFYPTDRYGQRMTALFENSLNKRQAQLQKASYNPATPATWSEAAKPLINPTIADDGKTTRPQTTFDALFVPDSWKHLDLVMTSLLYHGEDRLILLGPMLWEQSLANKNNTNSEKYAMAVFTGAYNSDRAPRKLASPGNDFWVALGYDFTNFAVNTGLADRLPAQEIIAKAQRAASQIRAMAPITWDRNGIARQHLYIFQAAPDGIRPVNIDQFKQLRDSVLERAALRMQGLEPATNNSQADPDSSALPEGGQMPAPNVGGNSLPASVQQPSEQPIMSSVPRPSYKLRLPSKR